MSKNSRRKLKEERTRRTTSSRERAPSHPDEAQSVESTVKIAQNTRDQMMMRRRSQSRSPSDASRSETGTAERRVEGILLRLTVRPFDSLSVVLGCREDIRESDRGSSSGVHISEDEVDQKRQGRTRRKKARLLHRSSINVCS